MAVKVLVVDDEDDIRSALRFMLEGAGDIDVDEAVNGQKALDALVKAQYDFMLLDINMPEVRGESVLESIATDNNYKRPGKIIVMSAQWRLKEMSKHLSSAGADAFLAKPFHYPEVEAILK